ncbi:MAG TPA: oxidoreductase [Actinobacteria bacterium]|nr:oxidoreductase [Actinomycetota bacterium]
MPSTDQLSVLLVGYGLAGRVFHAPLIRATPGLALTAVVTSNPERSIQAREAHPGVAVFSDLDAALSTPVDLVVIATANVTHLPYAMQALAAGSSVVVDKPVAGTAAEAQALADAAHDSGLLVIPFQNRRWDSDFLTAQRIFESGVLGMVHRFESRIDRMRVVPKPGWRGSADPADLGGMLYDLGSHLVDQALALMGPAVSVCATVRSVRPTDPTDDDVVLLITHDSGGVSVLSASQVAAFADPRMTLLGTRGGLRIHQADSQEDILRTGVIPDEDWGVEPVDHAAVLRTFDDHSAPTETRVPLERGRWPEFYRRVEQALRREGPPPVLMEDAVATVRVLDAARTSGTLRTTVTLDPPAGHGSTT